MLHPHKTHHRQLVHIQTDVSFELDRSHPLPQHLAPRFQESRLGEIGLVESVEEGDEVGEGVFSKGWGGKFVAEGSEEGGLKGEEFLAEEERGLGVGGEERLEAGFGWGGR